MLQAVVDFDFSCRPVATACLRDGVIAKHGTVSQYLSTTMGTKDFGATFDTVQVAFFLALFYAGCCLGVHEVDGC